MSDEQDCCGGERRADRLRELAGQLESAQSERWPAPERQQLASRVRALARAGDADWDDDPDHLAQAVDAVLDAALDAFKAQNHEQGIALVVAAANTIDGLLEAMNLTDADEGAAAMNSKPASGVVRQHQSGERAVDSTPWDGGAAMSKCSKSDTPGTCFGSICAGRKAGPPDQQASWALPHHKNAGSPPNAAGVTAALGRFDQTQGLTNSAEARSHLEAHQHAIQASSSNDRRPPRDNLVRALLPGGERLVLKLRDAGDGEAAQDAMPTMFGHFAVFNRWTEIDSFWEGNFMEAIAPGAFKRSIENSKDSIRTLFQHGRDPSTGALPLGTIDVLREDDVGAYYEVGLFDADYVQRILPALRSGQLGASFRFQVTRETVNSKPEASDHNPAGIPERTIQDLVLFEFGPVTFPAYDDATAGVRSGMRSMTDEWIIGRFGLDPRKFEDLVHHYLDHAVARPGRDLGAVHAAPEPRNDPPGGRLEVVRNPRRARP